MNYQTNGFEPFDMDRPSSIGGVEHAMLAAATKANEKGCVVLVGIRPSHKSWEEVIPLVFSPGNLNEALTTVKGTLDRVQNKFFLVGDVFPEVQIYLLYGAYVGNLLCADTWSSEVTEPMRWTIHNLHHSIIESGEVKKS